MKIHWVRKVFVVLGVVAVGGAALSYVVMLLWNALVPDLFRGPLLTFWQAAGVLVLFHVLLRGWSPWRYGNGWKRERWKHRFEERLAAMTPEEREKFRAEWRSRCGHRSGETPQA